MMNPNSSPYALWVISNSRMPLIFGIENTSPEKYAIHFDRSVGYQEQVCQRDILKQCQTIMVISPGGTSTTSVTSVQKTDHPLGPLGLGWNIASFPNADLHNVLVHQVVQQMSTFWWYPRYPWYLTKPVNQACVLCRTMLGYPFWGFFMFKRTVKPWLPWRIGWLTGYLLLGDLDMFDLDNSLIWTYLHRRSNLIPSPRSYQGSFLVVGWCWLELPMIQMHSTRHIYIYITCPFLKVPNAFWDCVLGFVFGVQTHSQTGTCSTSPSIWALVMEPKPYFSCRFSAKHPNIH